MLKNVKYLIAVLVIAGSLVGFNMAYGDNAQSGLPASSFQVAPQIIDAQAKAKEILDYTITIKNTSAGLLTLYAIVEDLTPDGQVIYSDPQSTDKSLSLAHWLEIKRSQIVVTASSSVDLPLKITVNKEAKPGVYHSKIIFGPGSGAVEAKQNALSSNQPSAIINLTVAEDIVEKAEIADFRVSKNIYLSLPVDYNITIKNVGNRAITPSGTLNIYDRKGEEVDTIDFNQDQTPVDPEKSQSYPVKWNPPGGFGKYKAKLNIEYGNTSKRDLNDSTDLWILPWKYLAVALAIIFFTFIILTYLIFKKSYPRRHDNAGDGVINLKPKR